ncbi:MAG: sel1 repeat family protein, partial [Deltaproteobacteria bacterium]|nr:sel1 repeat family protein [Deltaproteobacteria bacterium]
MLAAFLLGGDGLDQDIDEAVRMNQLAADQGNKNAENLMPMILDAVEG